MSSCWKETSILQLEDRKCDSFLIGTGRNGKIIGNWDICSTASRWDHSLSPLSFLLLTYSHTSPLQAAGFLCFPVQRRQLPSSFWASSSSLFRQRLTRIPQSQHVQETFLLVHRGSDVHLSPTQDKSKTLLTTFSSLTVQPHEPRAACTWLWVTEATQATLSTKRELQGRGLGVSRLQGRKSSCTPDLFWVTYPQLEWPMQSHNVGVSVQWKDSSSCSTTMKNWRCWQQNCPRVEPSKPRACEASLAWKVAPWEGRTWVGKDSQSSLS